VTAGPDPAAWGIAAGASPETTAALLAAMEADATAPPPTTTWVVRAGEAVTAEGRWELTMEDGATVGIEGALPPGVPLGYHRLTDAGGQRSVRLIVVPERCFLPTDLEAWGWAVQLPTLRSSGSWGIGDLADLGRLGRWAAGLGAGFLLVSPLHADRLRLPQQASPYSPSSRRFRNLLHLHLDGPGPAPGPIVERDPIFVAKLAALEDQWSGFGGDPDFDRYRAGQGDSLLGWATFCALDEGRPGDAGRIAFHSWVQWRIDRQLAEAARAIPLVHDLAVGFDPEGADAWQYRDQVAGRARIGAPPDEFNPAGQEWGLPPFDPWKLRAAGYQPFIETLRAAFGHAAGLRVDHVMGLFRQFWVPAGHGPEDGAYVHYPWRDLLGILALESHRARAWVVGEDLGTVEDSVRATLAGADVLGYRLLWFERTPPPEWPRKTLAAVTTHDLPTVAGAWSTASPVAAAAGLDRAGSADEAVEAAYRALASAPSMVRVATLEDGVGAVEQPNVPGTTSDVRPNWSIPLPLALEELVSDPRPARLARILGRWPTS
jgi:4-alpha-glucanotransferase